MFIGTVVQLKANRQIVKNVMGRWRKKAMVMAIFVWAKYVDEIKDSNQRLIEQEVQHQIADELAKEKWRALLETNGLLQVVNILEDYGIGSESDVSELNQDDFSKLESLGLKPLEVKKLSRWCEYEIVEKKKKKALQMHWDGRTIWIC
jgi:hypothetical protein